ncbi:MAG: acyl carrier protein [Solirubrobacteraceae bacterium]
MREDLELDSMDILNLVVAINEATGIDVPEQDYGELTTVATIVRYLDARAASDAATA